MAKRHWVKLPHNVHLHIIRSTVCLVYATKTQPLSLPLSLSGVMRTKNKNTCNVFFQVQGDWEERKNINETCLLFRKTEQKTVQNFPKVGIGLDFEGGNISEVLWEAEKLVAWWVRQRCTECTVRSEVIGTWAKNTIKWIIQCWAILYAQKNWKHYFILIQLFWEIDFV